MHSLVTFPIDLSGTRSALERIADALEHLVPLLAPPPLPLSHSSPYQAKLTDLRRTDPRTIARITQELETFSENNSVFLHSEAFLAAMIEFEASVAETYGPEALLELPWNKAAGGPLFSQTAQTAQGSQSLQTPIRANDPQQSRATHESDREPAPDPLRPPGSAS